MNLDKDMFKKASTSAMDSALIKTSEERLKIMRKSAYITIIDKLKEDSVDKCLIEDLESKINASTDKNQVILNVMKAGGTLAKFITKIIMK